MGGDDELVRFRASNEIHALTVVNDCEKLQTFFAILGPVLCVDQDNEVVLVEDIVGPIEFCKEAYKANAPARTLWISLRGRPMPNRAHLSDLPPIPLSRAERSTTDLTKTSLCPAQRRWHGYGGWASRGGLQPRYGSHSCGDCSVNSPPSPDADDENVPRKIWIQIPNQNCHVDCMAATTIDMNDDLKTELQEHPERFGLSGSSSLRRVPSELVAEAALLRRRRVEENRRAALYVEFAADPQHTEFVGELFALTVPDSLLPATAR